MTPAIEARGLVLGYGTRVAVASSDFTVARAAITAIIGTNGSGKSTLLHAMAGSMRPMAGRIRVLDQAPTEARVRMSYVLQTVPLPQGTPLTVRETVGMGRYPTLGPWRRRSATDRARVAEAMEALDITELAGRHLSELSGGQRQRVYVAQGLAQDHDILLLDEPLTGLDLNSARTIDRIIHDERDRGVAVVLTTHSLEEAGAADHVVLMSGRVLVEGPPDQVLTRDNLAAAYGLGALHDHATVFLDDPAEGSQHTTESAPPGSPAPRLGRRD